MRRCLLTLLLLLPGLLSAGQPRIVMPIGPADTGIYVESDYHENVAGCDWYFNARRFVEAEPPARTTPCPVIIRVRGALTPQGARRFLEVTEALADWPAVPTRIMLNSQGGDADSAFWIARAIRQHEVYRRQDGGVMTAIDEVDDAVCFSSCVVVFAAGFTRFAEFDEYGDPALPSRLGIHRPAKFDPRNLTLDTSADNRSVNWFRDELVAYFRSVGVSSALVDAMYAVPHEELHLLTEAEARRYGLVP